MLLLGNLLHLLGIGLRLLHHHLLLLRLLLLVCVDGGGAVINRCLNWRRCLRHRLRLGMGLLLCSHSPILLCRCFCLQLLHLLLLLLHLLLAACALHLLLLMCGTAGNLGPRCCGTSNRAETGDSSEESECARRVCVSEREEKPARHKTKQGRSC